MPPILISWLILCFTCFGVPLAYYLYMKTVGSGSWKLRIDRSHTPSITVLIPAHNEQRVIGLKLENICNVQYPPEKIEVIAIDDCSTDNTLNEIYKFLGSPVCAHSRVNIKVLSKAQRGGKLEALNFGLKHSTGEIVIVSDADCFWPRDILEKALPYFADPSVGAVIGREILLNSSQSWVTRSEATYANSMCAVKVGESKIHSTILSHGGFGAYRKGILQEFDDTTGSDDSGTALSLVQKQARTILVPEVMFFTTFPTTWTGKVEIKIRRANQLIRIWTKCLKLMVGNRLRLPKRIAAPQIFLYLFNPIAFVALIFVTLLFFSSFPIALVLFLPVLTFQRLRRYFLEMVLSNLILVCSLFGFIVGKKFIIWATVEEARGFIDRQLLHEKNLV